MYILNGYDEPQIYGPVFKYRDPKVVTSMNVEEGIIPYEIHVSCFVYDLDNYYPLAKQAIHFKRSPARAKLAMNSYRAKQDKRYFDLNPIAFLPEKYLKQLLYEEERIQRGKLTDAEYNNMLTAYCLSSEYKDVLNRIDNGTIFEKHLDMATINDEEYFTGDGYFYRHVVIPYVY